MFIIIIMAHIMVQKENYIPNSLRKTRPQAFEADLTKLYQKYQQSLKLIPPQQVTIQLFTNTWESLSMQFIYQCLNEDENQEEFGHMMYQIVLKRYFLYRNKDQRVFAIFVIYFLHYACQKRNKINVCPLLLDQLKIFVQENRNDKNSHYMKIIYHLFQKCFNFCTKIGLRNPIVKSNGQVPRKPIVVHLDPLQKINTIEQQFRQSNNAENPSLKQCLSSYNEIKKQMFRENTITINRDKFPTDTLFCTRVEKIIKSYKQYAVTIENERKKQEQD